MNIGENLKHIREARNMTRTALAAKVGVSLPMISQIERGTKAMSVQLAIAIADALDCTVADLCGVK